ncbi:MAG TPA: serine/threonine-protein kinase, partial [Methylomirabilota bacterium]|nr:serine/threonine-protein kinase [Methylomirabilota bacterium]
MTKRCPRCRKTFDQAGQFCPDDGAPLSAGNPLDPAIAAALAADYRILDWLGAGGMGTVFLAEQIRVGNRKVALKVLHRRFSEDEEFITRFENEAASTGRINHPNVITIYESKQAADRTLYIAMELVEGESLTEHLRKRGRLPLGEVVEVVSQCCKALQAAHRLGIIHRDIKPDNIMLTRDMDGGLLVKILDFGIAKLKDSSGHTVTGSVLGTPAYMSYEQASGLSSEKLDGRSDIYSLGLVTYTMLAGHPPFRSDTPVGYITKHLSEAPVPLRDLRPELPAPAEVAVMKALEKDREKRFQAAADFAGALREAAKAATAAPGSVPALDATPTPPPPWRPRPSAAQTTEVGLANPATLPSGGLGVPSSEAVTLPPGAVAAPAARPTPSPPPPRRPAPVTPSATPPPVITPPRP